MRITFLMPCYAWGPSGGFRIVYQYANHLTDLGHKVTVIHPRRLKKTHSERLTLRGWARKIRLWVRESHSTPSIYWQAIDKGVRLEFVRSSHPQHIPDGDVLFATAWHTVRSVLECPPAKGEKFYFIQGHNPWLGPNESVEATWRSPLHKIVVSKDLVALGERLGAADLAYVPNAVDHNRYRLLHAIMGRPRQVAMMFSPVGFKGASDGIEALKLVRKQHPDLKVVFFGTTRRQPWIPEWVEYHQGAAQQFIVSEIYNRSSIFLSPSWAEGFGLPPAEAAACGCAVVATDSGGVRDFIEHGVTGLLSPPRDPKALAENLCLLLGNESFRVRLAQAGNTFIHQFNWERSTTLFEDAIRAALMRVRPAPSSARA